MWNVRPLEEVAVGVFAARRFTLWLVGAFAVATLLLIVAAASGYAPARRASRVDPAVALRTQ